MSTTVSLRILSLALSCTLAAAPAFAEPDIRSVTVRTADLNLATPAGEQALHSRILRAVGMVCGDTDPRDLRASSAAQACRATAMANAMTQMQVAIADARSGKVYADNEATASRAAS